MNPERTIQKAKPADISQLTSHGWSPLHAAAENGHITCAASLIDAGVSVNQISKTGETPLHTAGWFCYY